MNLSAYLSRVLPSVDACPAPIAEQAVRDAIDSFCRQSRIYRGVQTVALTSGDGTYTLTPPANAVVVETLYARIGDDLLEPLIPELESRLLIGNGKPEYIKHTTPGDIEILPAPAETGSMSVTVIYSIDLTTTDFPSILDQWREEISFGAMARLMVMPNKPWSNPQMAAGYQTMFNAGARDAAAKATLGNRKATLRVQAHP